MTLNTALIVLDVVLLTAVIWHLLGICLDTHKANKEREREKFVEDMISKTRRDD